MKKNHDILFAILLFFCSFIIVACSSTNVVPEGDQLYVGLKKIKYQNYENCNHFVSTQAEVEAALATEPNGALLGSSYYRSPFQFGLWVWNAFSKDSTAFGKWMCSSFGKEPVLMSWVNPALRASVGKAVLGAHGYFNGKVKYEEYTLSNPKKAKIGYTVDLGHLYTIDTLSYEGFPYEGDSLIKSTMSQSVIHKGDAFDVNNLEAERTRISTLFRDNGFFYYQPNYSSYIADTITEPGKVLMKFKFADNPNEKVKHKWYIGKLNIQLRRNIMDSLINCVHRRHFNVWYSTKSQPIRMRVIMRNLKLRSGQLYSYDAYQHSYNNISTQGIFSQVDFSFAPHDSTPQCDSLDLTLNCVFDKPYKFYVETNAKGKTTGRMGPELVLGFTKRNAFRGGEKLDVNMHGSYEWQTNHPSGSNGNLNSYEYGGDISVEMPRLLLPFLRHHRFYTVPSTVIKATSNVINRADYVKRHIVSGELTYNFQTSATSLHQVSPLTMEYEYMVSSTDTFKTIMNANPYMLVSMQNQFIPKMSYSYTYTSPVNFRNPIYWRTIISESANILSLGYRIAGRNWDERNKQMFKNPYAQFFKIETNFRKTWTFSNYAQLVGHVATGIIYSYGNSLSAPYSEQFYVGGANSIRAFTVRSIGPGAYHTDQSQVSYMDQTGDIKFLANLEYRLRLFGNLYSAAFLDAGNVWAMRDGYREKSKFEMKNFFNQLAVGTGVGLRYDLDFFVLRIDWGLGLHLPYDTSRNGWYNIPKFSEGHSLHTAIGYPF